MSRCRSSNLIPFRSSSLHADDAPNVAEARAVVPYRSCQDKLRPPKPFPLAEKIGTTLRAHALSIRDTAPDAHLQKPPEGKAWQQCEAAWPSAHRTCEQHKKPQRPHPSHRVAPQRQPACPSAKDRTTPRPTRRTRPYRRGRSCVAWKYSLELGRLSKSVPREW